MLQAPRSRNVNDGQDVMNEEKKYWRNRWYSPILRYCLGICFKRLRKHIQYSYLDIQPWHLNLYLACVDYEEGSNCSPWCFVLGYTVCCLSQEADVLRRKEFLQSALDL